MASIKRALNFSNLWASTPSKAEKKAKIEGEGMHMEDEEKEEYSEVSDIPAEAADQEQRQEMSTPENQADPGKTVTISKPMWDQLMEKLDKLDKIDKMTWEVESLKDALTYHTKEFDELTKSQLNQGKEIDELKKEVKDLKDQKSSMKQQLLEIQMEQMKENLMIYGIEEELNPKTEKCEDKVKAFVENRLEIVLDDSDINKAYRIGKRDNTPQNDGPRKNRPFVVKLKNQRVKEMIKKAAPKLKGTRYGIGDQFPKEVADARKKLFPVLRRAKGQGKQAYIKYDKLYIDGRIYVGED